MRIVRRKRKATREQWLSGEVRKFKKFLLFPKFLPNKILWLKSVIVYQQIRQTRHVWFDGHIYDYTYKWVDVFY